jgi:hypothetical protein
MILAGDDNNQTVSVLTPPANSVVGDRVFLSGEKQGEPVKVLKPEIWEAVVHELKVQGGKAVYKDKAFVTEKGDVTVPNLPDGSGIH